MSASVLIRKPERIRDWDRWREVLCQVLGPPRGMAVYETYYYAWQALKGRGSKAQVLGVRLSLNFLGLDPSQVKIGIGWVTERLKEDGLWLWWKTWTGTGVSVTLLLPTLEGTRKLEKNFPLLSLAYRVCRAVEETTKTRITRSWERGKEEGVR